MNSRHVYIGNYYSFPTPSSKYMASVVEGFFMFFIKFSLNIDNEINIEKEINIG
jgi:hypothetical protein